ncbi:glycosyl hydrolase family 16 [Chitinophaga skermanii]|uniref:Glycosyl hydrolase family 16 n=1 Tax=Chitinophaga skermanii TaxID=331697 RepID=A0A327Q6W6_9BACT|nr:glycoside hydrolase family 16 protein [Chitinophaga skermanii]RAI99724.1 glycosyl hydrolase family 16 [Chitinophaga skermanii]
MQKLLGLALFTCLFACNKAQHPATEKGPKLVWSDEFDKNGAPDPTKWAFQVAGNGFGNNELQFYTNQNAWVENGKLIIEARKEKHENREYTSAKLWTKNIATWQYGKILVRAKLPAGRGTWPAIWMLPNKDNMKWPDDGEIDIMEAVGYEPGKVYGSVHTKTYNHVINTQKTGMQPVPTSATGFHEYGVEWTKDSIHFSVDKQVYYKFGNEKTGKNEWPFDEKFYLILNLAVGGNWGGAKGVDDTIFPVRMEVDYVRVYQ